MISFSLSLHPLQLVQRTVQLAFNSCLVTENAAQSMTKTVELSPGGAGESEPFVDHERYSAD